MVSDASSFDRLLRSWPPAWTAAIDAAASASDPGRSLRPVLAELGFDGLTCIVLASAAAGSERTLEMWCTAPSTWTERYRDFGYALVDPRVTMTARRLAPVIWDAADIDGDWTVRRFLGEAARNGVRSGFAVAFRERFDTRTVVAFDIARSPMGDVGCAAIAGMSGNLMLLAASLHERVIRPRLRAPANDGLPQGLTHREHQCLRMAAHGLTSGDIGGKLGIAERTVNFHMHNILRKMEAVNRPEAIAKALARGVLLAETIA